MLEYLILSKWINILYIVFALFLIVFEYFTMTFLGLCTFLVFYLLTDIRVHSQSLYDIYHGSSTPLM